MSTSSTPDEALRLMRRALANARDYIDEQVEVDSWPAPNRHNKAMIARGLARLVEIDAAMQAGACAAPMAQTPKATLSRRHLVTILAVSLFGSGVWVAGSWLQYWLFGWSQRPITFALGLIFAIAASNFASVLIDLHLWRASLIRPPEISGIDEAQS